VRQLAHLRRYSAAPLRLHTYGEGVQAEVTSAGIDAYLGDEITVVARQRPHLMVVGCNQPKANHSSKLSAWITPSAYKTGTTCRRNNCSPSGRSAYCCRPSQGTPNIIVAACGGDSASVWVRPAPDPAIADRSRHRTPFAPAITSSYQPGDDSARPRQHGTDDSKTHLSASPNRCCVKAPLLREGAESLLRGSLTCHRAFPPRGHCRVSLHRRNAQRRRKSDLGIDGFL
jgi:hypothetical protein